MAEQTAIELTDDLVGSTATQSVELGFRGTSCTIDLDDDNASDVDDAVAPCTAAAEASGGAQPSRSGAGPAHDPGQSGGCPDVVGAEGADAARAYPVGRHADPARASPGHHGLSVRFDSCAVRRLWKPMDVSTVTVTERSNRARMTEACEMSEYGRALGARLRAIRLQQGLSLHGVEDKSQGRWKAVVVGSYERGDRAVTALRLSELAAFYRVPVSELLPAGAAPARASSSSARVVLALDRLQGATSERAATLARYAAAIQRQRGDYNGRVLSLRDADLQTLAVIYGASAAEVTEQMLQCDVLAKGA